MIDRLFAILALSAPLVAGTGCQAYYPDPRTLEENRELQELDDTESFNFRDGLGRQADAIGQ